MEHIEDSRREVGRTLEKLAINGHLIVLAPAFQWLYTPFDKRIGHFRRYNKDIMRNEIDGRLKEEKLFYLDSIGLCASIANKLFLHKSLPTLKDIELWDKKMVPISRLFDPLIGYSFGKSLIGVYKKTSA